MTEPAFIPTPEYIAADKDYAIAQENYVKVAELYRTMMADDSEFLAARHWRDACLEAFDAAEADALERQPFTTELTPEGEQTVIPGCERQTTPKNPQGELF